MLQSLNFIRTKISAVTINGYCMDNILLYKGNVQIRANLCVRALYFDLNWRTYTKNWDLSIVRCIFMLRPCGSIFCSSAVAL